MTAFSAAFTLVERDDEMRFLVFISFKVFLARLKTNTCTNTAFMRRHDKPRKPVKVKRGELTRMVYRDAVAPSTQIAHVMKAVHEVGGH